MRNYKRFLAIAMATTMVFGSSLTAFAADPDDTTTTTTPATEGYSEGTGTSEGHVERKRTLVTLPTDVAASTFAYTMDPERLISGTAGAKYGDTVTFPSTGDTGVYFLTESTAGAKSYEKKADKPSGADDTKWDAAAATLTEEAYGELTDEDTKAFYELKEGAAGKKYENASTALTVTNKSSHDINLTVKAEVSESKATDIPLVADITKATDASLYLGLIVGTKSETNAAAAIAKDTAATKTVKIEGTSGNFKVDANSAKTGYEYRELTIAEYNEAHKDDTDFSALDPEKDTLPWQSNTFQLEGATTSGKEIASTTTAPKVKVTWSWVDPDATPSIANRNITISADTAFNVPVSLGTATAVTGLTFNNGQGATVELLNNSGEFASYANGVISLTAKFANAAIASPGCKLTVKFNDTNETEVELTFATE